MEEKEKGVNEKEGEEERGESKGVSGVREREIGVMGEK